MTLQPKYIKRTYRITEKQDAKVKKLAKKGMSESGVIRQLIDNA